MNVIEYVRRGRGRQSRKVDFFACGKCGAVWALQWRDRAEQCCKPRADDDWKEKQRLHRIELVARKRVLNRISVFEVDTFYMDHCDDVEELPERFYYSLDELYDFIWDDVLPDHDFTTYLAELAMGRDDDGARELVCAAYLNRRCIVHPCDKRTVQLDVDYALEAALEADEHAEGVSFSHEEELREFVEEWNEKQTECTWFADEKLVVQFGGSPLVVDL